MKEQLHYDLWRCFLSQRCQLISPYLLDVPNLEATIVMSRAADLLVDQSWSIEGVYRQCASSVEHDTCTRLLWEHPYQVIHSSQFAGMDAASLHPFKSHRPVWMCGFLLFETGHGSKRPCSWMRYSPSPPTHTHHTRTNYTHLPKEKSSWRLIQLCSWKMNKNTKILWRYVELGFHLA